MYSRNPVFYTDSYKCAHFDMFVPEVTHMYSHLTPRNNKYLKDKYPNLDDNVVVYGLQFVVKNLMMNWEEGFFSQPWDKVKEQVLEILGSHSGFTDKDTERFKKLHDLGYLPLEIKGLEEGTIVPIGTPVMTLVNTHPDFYWLTNYIESNLLGNIFKPITAATIARQLKKLRVKFAPQTKEDAVNFMLHDFSYRGHSGNESCGMSASAFLLASQGTDSLVGVAFAKDYYQLDNKSAFSIPATEHSVTTLAILYFQDVLDLAYPLAKEGETEETYNKRIVETHQELSLKYEMPFKAFETALECASKVASIVRRQEKSFTEEEIRKVVGETFNLVRLLLVKYPSGIFAYVSDSFNFWALVQYILPVLRPIILGRDGRIVIRPDSGDPVSVLCGTGKTEDVGKAVLNLPVGTVFMHEGQGYFYKEKPKVGEGFFIPFSELVRNNFVEKTRLVENAIYLNPQSKGVINFLLEVFSPRAKDWEELEVSDTKALKLLPDQIRVVYGDGMTYQRIDKIYTRLTEELGLSEQNVVLAAGAWMLSSISRDDLGFALKASHVKLEDRSISIYKDPKTDRRKTSPKGLLSVFKDSEGAVRMKDNVSELEESQSLLTTIYKNGELVRETTFKDIQANFDKTI